MNKLLQLAVALCLLLGFSLPAAAAVVTSTGEPYYTLGDSWDYTLTHQVRVYNSSSSAATDITVTVPLIDEQLTDYNQLIGQELSPYPDRIYTGSDGHRYAEYHFDSLAGKSSVTLTQRYALQLWQIKYTCDQSTVPPSYSQAELAELAKYLQPTRAADSSNPTVVSFTQNAIAGESNPYQRAYKLFAAVNMAMGYSTEQPQDAATVLSRKSANCEGYTNLLIACLRAAGIPARAVSGYLYQPEKHLSNQYFDTANNRWLLTSLGHSWVEFYLPDTGWVMADPTYNYTITINGVAQRFPNRSYFAEITSTRRYFSLYVGDRNHRQEATLEYTGQSDTVDTETIASMIAGHYYLPFNDIAKHWGRDAILYCAENNLFNGVSPSLFKPDAPMTRAMFVAVLGRLYQAQGGDVSEYSADALLFTDVSLDAYYAPYLAWAVTEGIVQGFSEERFAPNNQVTREQMARMLALFLDSMDMTLTAGPTSVFSDSSLISDWAAGHVSACAQAGLINGLPGARFAPQANASRAQVATTVQRVANLLEQ